MLESVFHQVAFNVTPQELYEAWLDSAKHAAMTGSGAECTDKEGVGYTAWDGYITGVNLKLNPGKQIVQSWRTTEFKASDQDSRLEINIEPTETGSLLSLKHTEIPEGQTQYEQGWIDSYFTPMKDYFHS